MNNHALCNLIRTFKIMYWKNSRNTKENGEDLDESDLYEGNTVLYENEAKTYVKIILKTGMYKYYCTQ